MARGWFPTEAQLNTIEESVKSLDEVPWCCGLKTVPSDMLQLFFRAETGKRSEGATLGGKVEPKCQLINLSSPTKAELDALAQACNASSGVGLVDFGLNISPGRLGFTNIIKKGLLTPQDHSILFKLHKIDIHGKQSCSKSSRDSQVGANPRTSESQRLFGSLVIVFPTLYSGGEAVVSRNEQNSAVDFPAILKESPPNTVGYIAFFKDVDHQVGEVTSGHRVSLTYHLYYTDSVGGGTNAVHAPIATSYDRMYRKLRAVLTNLTRDPEFLPEGGMLGFRLNHQYTIPENAIERENASYKHQSRTDLPLISLIQSLKGSDAVIHKVCENLGLTVKLKFIYLDKSKHPPLQQMCDVGLNFEGHIGYGYDVARLNMKHIGQRIHEKSNFTWVRMKLLSGSGGTSLKIPYPVCDKDNQAQEVRYIYGKLAIVVWIGPPDCREDFDTDYRGSLGKRQRVN